MSNTRPADFPTDAEMAQAQPLTTLAALLDAFVGSDEWDEHDVREQCEAATGRVAVVGDVLNGNPFWTLQITKHFLAGDMTDYAYTFGDVATANAYGASVAAERGFVFEAAQR